MKIIKDYTNFAPVSWNAEDIQTLRPTWDIDKCEEFLCDNESAIQDRIIEHGWEIIEALLD